MKIQIIKTKYNHVGRPSKEEVNQYKRNKKIKLIGLIILIFVILGSVFIYINKDKIDLSSIMGNSTSEKIKNIQNSEKYRLIYFVPEKKSNDYYYQEFSEDGSTNYVLWLFKESGFNKNKYNLSKINFYYNGKEIITSRIKKIVRL